MELQTREEVHLLCLFDELDSCLEWEEEVRKRLPERENRPDHFPESSKFTPRIFKPGLNLSAPALRVSSSSTTS
jgi:hypothetical protein